MSEHVHCSQRMGQSQPLQNVIHAPGNFQASPYATPTTTSCAPKSECAIEFRGNDAQKTQEAPAVAVATPATQSVPFPTDDPRLSLTELEHGSLCNVVKANIAREPNAKSCGSTIGDLSNLGDNRRVLRPLPDPELNLPPHKADSLAVMEHASALGFGEHADMGDPVFESRTGQRRISRTSGSVSDAGHTVLCRKVEEIESSPPSIDRTLPRHIPMQSRDVPHVKPIQTMQAGPHNLGQQPGWVAQSDPTQQISQDIFPWDVRCCILLHTVHTYMYS